MWSVVVRRPINHYIPHFQQVIATMTNRKNAAQEASINARRPHRPVRAHHLRAHRIPLKRIKVMLMLSKGKQKKRRDESGKNKSDRINVRRRNTKKAKRMEKKQKKMERKAMRDGLMDEADCGPPISLMNTKARAPQTKEDYDKIQSNIRRVVDPESGRTRLIKGDGEILEEIVTRDRHKAINRNATKADGEFFQSRTVGWADG